MAEQTEQLLEQVRQLLHSGDAAALRSPLTGERAVPTQIGSGHPSLGHAQARV